MYVINKNTLSPKLSLCLWEGHWDRACYNLGWPPRLYLRSQGCAWIWSFPDMLGYCKAQPDFLELDLDSSFNQLPQFCDSEGAGDPRRGLQWLKPLRTQGSCSMDSHPSQSSSSSASLGRLLKCTQSSQPPAPSTRQHFVSKLHSSIGSLRGLNELIPVMCSEWSW